MLWAIVYTIALHGKHVLTGADVPVLVGVLLAIYPTIDATASLAELRKGRASLELRAGFTIDVLAIAGLLVSTFALHTQYVITAFGAWAAAAGLLQVAGALRAGRPRRAQLPLIISGTVSTIVGATFIAMATQHVAHLSKLEGYPVLGAVFFLLFAAIDYRQRARKRSAH